MYAIEMTGVSKWFGDVHALDETDLCVQEGKFVSLVGPSGCGKTTLLRIAAGLELATQGEVKILGGSPLQSCQQHDIGLAFQAPALLPSKTALENVRLTLEITGQKNGMKPPEDILVEFGLGNSLQKYPHQLSGGMQQRVNIAGAMVHNPKILLMDEPFGALDLLTREELSEWLEVDVLLGARRTVLFITHSVDEAVFHSDRVVVMSSSPGRIDGDFRIDLSRPRDRSLRSTEVFVQYCLAIRAALYETANGGE